MVKEYIKREAALNELKEELEMYIPMCTEEQNHYIDLGLKIAVEDIKNLPSADVVEAKELNDLLYVIRTNMTSITRYVRHKRDEHLTLTEGQFIDRHLKYKELAESAVSNILKYINGTN
jgi:hypothetical protein